MTRFARVFILLTGLCALCAVQAPAQNGGGAPLANRIDELEQGYQALQARVQQLEDRLRAVLGDPGLEPIRRIPTGSSPMRGSPSASLTLVVFADYQSAYSARAEHALQRLLENYPNALRIVHKHYPLRTQHPQAHDAALAAIAAQRQGKFWEMHERLIANSMSLSPALYTVLAGELGLDLLGFDRDRTSLWALEQLDADENAAVDAGVDGVPTLFLNGRRLETWRYDYVRAQIERMLPEGARR